MSFNRNLHCFVTLACLAVLFWAPSVDAQEPARRPYRRIFNAAPERPGSTERLDFRFSLAESYDDSLVSDPEAAGGQTRGGTFPSGIADVTYRRHMGTAIFQATGGSSVQYYPALDDRVDRSHSGGVDLDAPLGQRTRLRVAQTASYATFATLLGLPGSVIMDPGTAVPGGELLNPAESFGVSSAGGWQFNTHAALSRQLGRRGALEGHYGYSRTDLATLFSTFNDVGLRYSYSVTRQSSVVAGYSYQRGRSGEVADVVFHNVNLGMSHTRRLPGLRNTSVAFSTGSAVLVREAGREISLLGDVRLVHLMARSWSASLGYHRGVEFMSVLGSAVESDTVTSTLNGLLNPRLETWVSASYSRGNLGSSDGSPIRSFAGIVRGQYALSRRFAMDAQYIHYFHAIDENPALPGLLVPRLNRNAVRIGVTLLMPVID